jgi:LCP family protein required for cell wall assembly
MHVSTAPTRRLLAAAAIAIIVAACGSTAPTAPAATATAAPAATSTASPSASPADSASPSPEASSTPSPSPSPTAPVGDLTKAPFTVLVMGGDNGFRTDAMVVVGIDPVKKTVTFASLPRDTTNVPLPDGGIFSGQKVNAFYNFAAASPSRYPQGPGRATADMMGKLLGIHIDFYAATTFAGFTNLVNAVGGVRVNVPKTVVDPYYQITTTNVGIRFNTGWQVMGGARALIYSRTRMGDNDFERSRRQQIFLTNAGNQLLSKPSLLALYLKAAGNLVTDFPMAQVPALIEAIGAVAASSVKSGTVFGPSTYSSVTPCACGYALNPKLAPIRKTAAALFPWAVAH